MDNLSLFERCARNPLVLDLLGHPPTANHMWKRGRHGVYKTKDAQTYANIVGFKAKRRAFELYGTHRLEPLVGFPLRVEIKVFREVWTGKTKAKRYLFVRPDLDNFVKALVDAVTNAIGLDDGSIVKFDTEKAFRPGEDSTLIKLEFLRVWEGIAYGQDGGNPLITQTTGTEG